MAKIVYDGSMDQELIREASRRFLHGDARPVKITSVQVFPGLMLPCCIDLVECDLLHLESTQGRWVYCESTDPESRSLKAVEGGE